MRKSFVPVTVLFVAIIATIAVFVACGTDDDKKKKPDTDTTTPTNKDNTDPTGTETAGTPDCSGGQEKSDIASGVPEWVKNNFSCASISVSGTNLVFKTKDLPPFKSYYYGSSHSQYEALPSGNHGNPNKIQEQSVTLTIPSSPTVAGATTATGLGAIGITVKGTLLYNNQAAPGDTLANELATMDQSNGHPTNIGQYHHHTEPTKLTNNDAALVGVLLDGFPVYGRKDEDGTYPSNLDASNGHTHATTLFPDGIYHYHITTSDPYIAGSYKGKPGTTSK